MSRPLVVVADPNDATRDLLEEVCKAEFKAYVTKLNSVSELDFELHESVPRLILVEIGRDRLADVESLRELKRRHPAIPFIVLTAWGVKRDEVEATVGAEAVIAKPFDLEDVINRAAALLERQDEIAS